MEYDIVEEKKEEIIIEQAIKQEKIIGVILKSSGRRTCTIRIDTYKYSFSPCASSGLGSYWGSGEQNVSELLAHYAKQIKIVKAFDYWWEAYQWMAKGEDDE